MADEKKPRSLINLGEEFSAVKGSTISAVRNMFPIVGKQHTLRLDDAWVDDNIDDQDFRGQLRTKMEEKTWGVPVVGKVSMVDNATGRLIDRKDVRLADLPKPTPRFSYLVKGQEYQLEKQWRLRPGVYTREKESGGFESHINTASGDRMAFEFDPGTRKFSMKYGGASLPLYPLMQVMGVDRKDLSKSWGPEILDANSSSNYEKTILKAYKRIFGRDPVDLSTAVRELREYFNSRALDPQVTKLTLGKSVGMLDQSAFSLTTKKLLDVARGKVLPDNRDALPFKTFHAAEDFVEDRVKAYSTGVKRRLVRAVDKEAKIDAVVYPGILDKAISSVFTDTGLARASTQDNPVAILEGQTAVTLLGPGGVSDPQLVTEEAKGVDPSQVGFIDPIDTPEGEKAGLSSHLALGALKKGNEVHTRVYDLRTKKPSSVDPVSFIQSTVVLPDSVRWVNGKPVPLHGKTVRALGPDNRVIETDISKADYVLPSTVGLFGPGSAMVPFLGNNSALRVNMAARHIGQAVPLRYREVPLVQATDASVDVPLIKLPGSLMSAKSRVDGTVSKIERGAIHIKDKSGKSVEHQIYDYFPLNEKKSGVHSESTVKVGDKVSKGQIIADSSYTKDGNLAMGTNLRIGFIAIPGKTFEDAIVVSETASKKLSSTHLHRHYFDPDDTTRTGKNTYSAYYPMRFNRDQLGKLDDDGVVREGTTVDPGDPLTVSLREQKFTSEAKAMARLKKSLVKPYSDDAVTWDSSVPGKVVRVHRLPDGKARVFIATEEPAQIADKISAVYGNKGTIVEIRPDAEMPRTKDGRPLEVALNPYGVGNRMNLGQVYEVAAGKIAEKTGHPYKVPQFSPEVDWGEKIRADLKKHGLSDKEEVVDPATGRTLGNVTVGPMYIIKQRHMVERKISARAGGAGYSYDMDRQPRRGGQEGAQSLGGLGNLALLAHGARNIMRESSTYKSDLDQQDQLWRSIQLGQPLPPPKPTFAQKKFEGYLNTLGVKLKKTGPRIQMVPMRDAEIYAASSGEIQKPNLVVRGHDLSPEPGGLFDQRVTGGLDGTKMSHIALPEKIPNPFFERGVLSLTGLTQDQLLDVLAGKSGIKDGQVVKAKEAQVVGSAAISKMLKSVNVDQEIKTLRDKLPSLSGQMLDRANKKLRYLEALKSNGLDPETAYMTSAVPVLPPSMRPIVPLPSGDIATDPMNETYKALGTTVVAMRDMDPSLPERSKGRLRKELYTSLSALQGIGAGYKRVQGGETQGVLDLFTQPTAKHAWVQQKLFKGRQDLSARSVIVPDPDMSMDEIGVPHRIASVIYKPFVIRELTRAGYAPLQADQMVKENHPAAEAMLEKVMEERPVLAKRDPVLHKYGIQAFKPRLHHGMAIKIHPLVTTGYNADFDGNCIIGESKIVLTFDVPPAYIDSDDAVVLRIVEEMYGMKFAEDSKVLINGQGRVGLEVFIKDIPHGEEFVLDKNGARVHGVPEGISVLSTSLDGGSSFEEVTGFTVEDSVKVKTVTTRKRFEVTASSNESLCVFDHKSGTLVKCSPDDGINKLVPIVARPPVAGRDGSFLVGWTIGAFVSDGFFMGDNRTRIGYSKVSQAHRDRFDAGIRELEGRAVKRTTYRDVHGTGDSISGESVKDHFYNLDASTKLFSLCYAQTENMEGRAALRKRLPPIGSMCREALLGILSGLLDGDGSVSISRAKSREQILVSYGTSSKYLVDSVRQLCWRLGVRCSVSSVEPKPGRMQTHTAYVISLSTVDIAGLATEMDLVDQRKREILQRLGHIDQKDDRDIVPIPFSILKRLTPKLGVLSGTPSLQRSLAAIKSKLPGSPYCSRSLAVRILDVGKWEESDRTELARWRKLVGYRDLHWDLVTEVEDAGTTTVYDLIVPTTKIFSVNKGLVVYDTMSLYTPITMGAVEDAKKMMPSNNLLSPSTGRPMYTPSNEMALGLFRATRMQDPSKAKKFSSTQEALAAHERGDVGWDTVDVGGKATTIGRIKIHQGMPASIKDESMLWDKAQVWDSKHTKDVLGDLARRNPQEYARFAQTLMDTGAKNVYEDAVTISVDDLVPDKVSREKYFDRARKDSAKVLKNAKLTPVERDEQVVDIWSKAGDEMEKEHWDKVDKGEIAPNVFTEMVQAGTKPGRGQYKQMILAPTVMSGVRNREIPNPVTKSFSEGVDTAGFWVQSMAGRQGALKKTQEVRDPGYLTKQLINTVADSLVTSRDCGTTEGISLSVDHPDASGRYLTKAVSAGGETIPAGTEVTTELVGMLRKSGVQNVQVRSPLKCKLPQGVCSKCYGKSPEGRDIEIGTNIGVIAGQAIGERSTQLMLKAFHTGGVTQKPGTDVAASQFERVVQALRMPQNIRNSAVLAETSGTVSRKVPDPAGGFRITIKSDRGVEVEQHVPGTRSLLDKIKMGARVSSGEQLSTGVSNVHDILRTAGLPAVQNQIVNDLDDIYRKEGIKRRNVEVIARGVTNLARVDDPGGHPTARRGDSMPISVINAWNSDNRDEKPVKYTALLKGIGFAPLELTEDWIAKMHHERIKETLVDAALEGHESNISGYNPFSARAMNPQFGVGDPKLPGSY